MEDKDYLIPELEKRLKRAREIKEKLDNPEPDRLLSTQRTLKKEIEELMDDKTRLYEQAKMVIASRVKLICRTDKNEIGFIRNYSQAGHPEICYANEGRFTLPIATFRGVPFIELTPEEFMGRIVKGDFKPLDHLCLRCEKLVPYGNTICPDCGSKI